MNPEGRSGCSSKKTGGMASTLCLTRASALSVTPSAPILAVLWSGSKPCIKPSLTIFASARSTSSLLWRSSLSRAFLEFCAEALEASSVAKDRKGRSPLRTKAESLYQTSVDQTQLNQLDAENESARMQIQKLIMDFNL